jgi:PhnB protein
MAIKGGRPDTRQISPHLIVRGGEQAIEFYKQAFGADVLYRAPMPSGVGVHAQLRIGDSVVLISDENLHDHPELAVRLGAPETLGGTCVLLELYVDDVDAAFERAVRAGARPTMPPAETFFGDRYGWVTDPFGQIWSLATVHEELSPEAIAARLQGYASQPA